MNQGRRHKAEGIRDGIKEKFGALASHFSLVFCLLLSALCLILDRWLFLNQYSFQWVCSDQMIFWQGAHDYMHGIFHEPYFYGQNYNFMLEALLAVPMLAGGLPYATAMALTTSLLALLPFIVFSLILYRRSYIVEALFVLSLPVLLPVDYELLSSLTRGFVTGLAVCGFLAYCLISPGLKRNWILFGGISALAFILNPNSLVVVFPVAVFIFLSNYRQPAFYLWTLVAALPVLSIEYFAKLFYIRHPAYNVGGMWAFDFRFARVFHNLGHLDDFFAYLSPVIWFWGWFPLVIILLCGIWLMRYDWRKAASLIAGVIFAIALTGINKVNDSLGTIFLHSSRMFLGLPLFLGLAFLFVRKYMKISDERFAKPLMLITLVVFTIKVSLYKPVIQYHTKKENFEAVAVRKVDSVKKDCDDLYEIAKKNDIGLVVFLPDYRYNIPSLEYSNYGCPLLIRHFPHTVINVYEKRTWVFEYEKQAVYKNILLYGEVYLENFKDIGNWELVCGDPVMTVIRDNHLKTGELLEKLKIIYKRNLY
ncbi:MAG: hypothetical protein NTU44_13995 [Bacteroidetes bacterium]|nr:hypothetical protein [Bacteroidota bacterium]